MVKIAIAGASGQVAREIIDGLVATKKHEIIGLMRRDASSLPALPNIQWVHTSYQDKGELVHLLRGVHTVLSFINHFSDPTAGAEIRLIDAAVEAGVQRFAPAEWAVGEQLSSIIDAIPWYQWKLTVRSYLRELNRVKKVLEYSLFQPGQFTNYLGHPHQTTNHIAMSSFTIDFNTMHAVVDQDHKNAYITLTTAEDLVNVVVRAVDYLGRWPEVGGITGTTIKIVDLLALGERIRGKPFRVDWVKYEDLQAGILSVNRLPDLDHPVVDSLQPQERDEFRKKVMIGTLLLISHGAWQMTDQWNHLLPDYKFTEVEDFLRKVWVSG